jgi:hypothetical protein
MELLAPKGMINKYIILVRKAEEKSLPRRSIGERNSSYRNRGLKTKN